MTDIKDIEEATKNYIKKYKNDHPKIDVAMALALNGNNVLKWTQLLQVISNSNLKIKADPKTVSKRINRYQDYLDANLD